MKTNNTYHQNNQILPISTKLSKWPFIIAAVGLIGILSFCFLSSHFKIVIIASSFILLFFKEVYGRIRIKEIKKQRYTTQKPYAWKIVDPKKTEHPDFVALKEYFRQIQENTNQSILFIIERVTPEDHQAHLYESIVQDLRKEDRLVERFFHRGEFKLFWTEGYPNEITAEELTAKYSNWLPIFCSDGHRLIDYELESLSDIIFPFYVWNQPILLTNRPARSWSYEEDLLSVVFNIISFNLTGVNSISRLIKQTGLHHFKQLDEKKELLLKDDEKQIPEKLEAHFGIEFTRWIAATALCSKLDWDLTLKIGEYLSKNHNTLNNHTQLRQLSRLGWFRVGEMPEQVRMQLIEYLPLSFQYEIRQLIIEAMEKSPPPYPSHAHNSYRMELVSHKLLIPDFPQKGLKEEYSELKSIGHIKEVGALNILINQASPFEDLLPEPIKQRIYNDGGALFGWNLKLLIPFLFVVSGAFAMAMDFILPKPPVSVTLNATVEDITGNSLEEVSFSSEFGSNTIGQSGQFSLEIPAENMDQEFEVTFKKPGYFSKTMSLHSGENKVSIDLLPKKMAIQVMDNTDGNITNAKVTLLTNATLIDSAFTDENGIAILSLKDKYKPTDKIKSIVEKSGFDIQTRQFQYNSENKTVYMENGVILRGKIKNQCSNYSLTGVQVMISGYPSTYTDQDGYFKFKLPNNFTKKNIEVDFSKDKYYSEKKLYSLDNLNEPQDIQLMSKKIVIKVIDIESEDRLIGIKLSANGSEQESTNEWGKSTVSLSENSDCEIRIQVNEEGYENLKKTYEIDDNEIIVRLTKNNKPPSIFKGHVKEKCGPPLDNVNITTNDLRPSKISTKNGNISFEWKDGEEKKEIIISKSGYYDARKVIEKKDQKNRATFELSPKNITFKIVNADDPKNGIEDVDVRFENGKIVKTDSQGEFTLEVDKTFDCAQTIQIEHDGYKAYSQPMKMQMRTVLINLLPKDEFKFIVEVKNIKESFEGIKVIGHHDRGRIEFKEIETGVFQYIVKEKDNHNLYDYIESGKNLSLTCSKPGYCEYTIKQALSKDKTNASISMNHYFENFTMEVIRKGVHQGNAIFRYNDKLLETTQTDKGFYKLVRKHPNNQAILKALNKRKNCEIRVSAPNFRGKKSVNLKDFCTDETIRFIIKD